MKQSTARRQLTPFASWPLLLDILPVCWDCVRKVCRALPNTLDHVCVKKANDLRTCTPGPAAGKWEQVCLIAGCLGLCFERLWCEWLCCDVLGCNRHRINLMFCPTLLISHILPQSFSFDDVDDDDNTDDDANDDKSYHKMIMTE